MIVHIFLAGAFGAICYAFYCLVTSLFDSTLDSRESDNWFI